MSAQQAATALNVNDVRQMAINHGYKVLSVNEGSRVASFGKLNGDESTRVNVYYTTGCVGTVLHHPNHEQARTQLFRRDCSMDELAAIFANPRVHTNKGYITLLQLKQREAEARGLPPPTRAGGRNRRRGRGGRGRGGQQNAGDGSTPGQPRQQGQGQQQQQQRQPRAPRAERTPRSGASQTTLFVAKLPRTLDSAGLLAAFRQHHALDAQVALGRRGTSIGFGFVLFGGAADLQRAAAAMNGKTVGGAAIGVAPALIEFGPVGGGGPWTE